MESFNHQLLTYLSKRIRYSTATYRLRMNLAVLDWVSTVVDLQLANIIVHNINRMRMYPDPLQVNVLILIKGDQTGEHPNVF